MAEEKEKKIEKSQPLPKAAPGALDDELVETDLESIAGAGGSQCPGTESRCQTK